MENEDRLMEFAIGLMHVQSRMAALLVESGAVRAEAMQDAMRAVLTADATNLLQRIPALTVMRVVEDAAPSRSDPVRSDDWLEAIVEGDAE